MNIESGQLSRQSSPSASGEFPSPQAIHPVNAAPDAATRLLPFMRRLRGSGTLIIAACLPLCSGMAEEPQDPPGMRLPSADHAWTAKEYEQLASAVTWGGVQKPVLSDATGKEIFDRFADPSNLSEFRKSTVPLKSRLEDSFKVSSSVRDIYQAYSEAAEEGADLHGETARIIAFALYVAALGNDLVDEFAKTEGMARPGNAGGDKTMTARLKRNYLITDWFDTAQAALKKSTFHSAGDFKVLLNSMEANLPVIQKAFSDEERAQMGIKLKRDQQRFTGNEARQLVSMQAILKKNTGQLPEIIAIKLSRRNGLMIADMSFSPDGKRLVGAIPDGTVPIWDVESGEELMVLKGHENYTVTGARFSPDGKRVISTGDDETARIWDAGSGRELLVLRGHEGRVCSGCISPDGKRAATASHDKTARIWDAESGMSLRILTGHSDFLYTVAFSPDGKQVVTAAADGTARVWDVESGREVRILNVGLPSVNSAVFSPDGSLILTAGSGGDGPAATLWDAGSGKRLHSVKCEYPMAAFWKDGSQWLIVGPGGAVVRDSRTGARVDTLTAPGATMITPDWLSPDGRRVAAADEGQHARILPVIRAKK